MPRPYPKQGMPDKKPKKSIKRSPIKKKYKPTGEKALFVTILQVRGNKSQISGKTLYGDFNSSWFSHILSKGAYPKFRLYDKNIVIKTPDEHRMWETQKHKLKNLPEWKWVFELEQELKEEYNGVK